MPSRNLPFAIIYDFDGTLAPGNMQERNFIPEIGMKTDQFWAEVRKHAKRHQADEILSYMQLMLKKAEAAEVQVKKENFENYGKDLDFFEGILPYINDQNKDIKGWFDRLNIYGKQGGLDVNHYVVSSGLREMISGTPVASKFKKIYASGYFYNHHGIADWPALALNYTTKTQYIFRINKGSLDEYDHSRINEYVPHNKRSVPFANMVFIGDGATDIPCFRLVKEQGGHSIAVYQKRKRHARSKSVALKKDGRVNFFTPADFRENETLDRLIKGVMDKVATDHYLGSFA